MVGRPPVCLYSDLDRGVVCPRHIWEFAVTTPRLENSTDSEQFPIVRKGYQCEVVDGYARRTRTELDLSLIHI